MSEGRFETSYTLEEPYDLASTLSPLGMGRADPCVDRESPDRVRLAFAGSSGPVVITAYHSDATLHVCVEGDDATFFESRLTGLLGLEFPLPPKLEGPRRLREIAHRRQGMRLPRTPLLFPQLVKTVLQQLVSWNDATHGWRQLVQRYGTSLSGEAKLFAPPTPKALARLATHHFVECGILPEHGRRIVRLARIADRIETTWGGGLSEDAIRETCELLEHQRGVGPWTLAMLRGTAMGDGNVVVRGDYGLPSQVAYFFGEPTPATDDDLERLLEPYRPHRFLVTWLIVLSGHKPPRRGPRAARLRDRMRPRGPIR